MNPLSDTFIVSDPARPPEPHGQHKQDDAINNGRISQRLGAVLPFTSSLWQTLGDKRTGQQWNDSQVICFGAAATNNFLYALGNEILVWAGGSFTMVNIICGSWEHVSTTAERLKNSKQWNIYCYIYFYQCQLDDNELEQTVNKFTFITWHLDPQISSPGRLCETLETLIFFCLHWNDRCQNLQIPVCGSACFEC